MTERARRYIGQWAVGAISGLLVLLTFAQPASHHSDFPAASQGGLYANSSLGQRAAQTSARAGTRSDAPHSEQPGARRWGLRVGPLYERYAMLSAYQSVSADLAQAAGASADGAKPPLRTGSIRADVARYNEERGGRPVLRRSEPVHSSLTTSYHN